MGNKITILFVLFILFLTSVYADDIEEEKYVTAYVAKSSAADQDAVIQFNRADELLEQAGECYANGDYHEAMIKEEEAIDSKIKGNDYRVHAALYAELIDKMYTVGGTIKSKKGDLEEALANDVPDFEYKEAEAYYKKSCEIFNSAERANDPQEAFAIFDNALNHARMVARILDGYLGPAGSGSQPGKNVLPAQYTVRSWTNSGDCLWNIAGQPWAYGNPHEWRRIYDANRGVLKDGPDMIEPGMILNIPSIKGETRRGMWESGKKY